MLETIQRLGSGSGKGEQGKRVAFVDGSSKVAAAEHQHGPVPLRRQALDQPQHLLVGLGRFL